MYSYCICLYYFTTHCFGFLVPSQRMPHQTIVWMEGEGMEGMEGEGIEGEGMEGEGMEGKGMEGEGMEGA